MIHKESMVMQWFTAGGGRSSHGLELAPSRATWPPLRRVARWLFDVASSTMDDDF